MATTTHPHTLVGVFRRQERAFDALRRLDADGLPPHHVGLVAGDPELASEIGSHDRALVGAIGGFILGLGVTVFYVAVGGPSFLQNVPGIVLGGLFVSFGLAFIGVVFGRALVVHPSHGADYAHAVEDGGAVVSVQCVADECDHARRVLEGAAADEIVEEGD